jgi:hypothetical protein
LITLLSLVAVLGELHQAQAMRKGLEAEVLVDLERVLVYPLLLALLIP